MLKVLDLFSGIGGFSLGLERTGGFETVAFCEIDPFCRQVLAKHWPGVPCYDDVRELTAERLQDDGVLDMAGTLKKLTQSDVAEAVRQYEGGDSLGKIATRYSVSRQSMHDLLKRRTEMRPKHRYGPENHFYRGGPAAVARAHDIVEKAVQSGRLQPQCCEVCGDNGAMADGRRNVQAHHDDYSKPLAVRWLCQKHHHEWHAAQPINNQPQEAREPAKQIDVICGGFP